MISKELFKRNSVTSAKPIQAAEITAKSADEYQNRFMELWGDIKDPKMGISVLRVFHTILLRLCL